MLVGLKLFIKVLPYIWPFMKGIFLGKKTWLEAFRDNKKKVFLLFVCLFSFSLNFIMVPRATHLAIEYIALEKRYLELQKNYDALNGSKKTTIADSKEVKLPEKTAPATQRPPLPSKDSSVEDIQDAFNRMRDREKNEQH